MRPAAGTSATGALFAVLLAACGTVGVVDRTETGGAILLRGGQPTIPSLTNLHDRYGIRTVVNLRGSEPGDESYAEERRAVEAIGARWVQLPFSGRAMPSHEFVTAFFDLVEDPRNWPIFIHSEGGVHRTGLVVALYRIQYKGWPAGEALEAMNRESLTWGANERTALRRYVLAFNADPARRLPAAVSGGASEP
jgi:protein tyrosine/serine phosphatase